MSPNSKGYYAIALKFTAKQIDLLRKERVSAIYKITHVNVDSRIFLNASHSVFLKKHLNTNKIKTKLFPGKLQTHFCRECYDLKIGVFGAPFKCLVEGLVITQFVSDF